MWLQKRFWDARRLRSPLSEMARLLAWVRRHIALQAWEFSISCVMLPLATKFVNSSLSIGSPCHVRDSNLRMQAAWACCTYGARTCACMCACVWGRGQGQHYADALTVHRLCACECDTAACADCLWEPCARSRAMTRTLGVKAARSSGAEGMDCSRAAAISSGAASVLMSSTAFRKLL